MYFSDDMTELVAIFKKHKVKFAVCGGFAVAHYGFVRATMDFDLLVVPDEENATRLMASLEEFGFGATGITDKTFLKSGVAVTLGSQPNQIDLRTSMSSKPAAKIIDNARTIKIHGVSMKIVSYDDLLLAKKESNRPKDQIDFEELMKLSPHM